MEAPAAATVGHGSLLQMKLVEGVKKELSSRAGRHTYILSSAPLPVASITSPGREVCRGPGKGLLWFAPCTKILVFCFHQSSEVEPPANEADMITTLGNLLWAPWHLLAYQQGQK